MLDLSHLSAKSPELFQAALKILASFSFDDLKNVPIQERLKAVAHIKNAVLTRPDQKVSAQETDLLIRILGAVKFSSDLENLLLSITKNAVDKLTKNSEDVSQWLNLENEAEESRKTLYQRLHNAIIFQAHSAFADQHSLTDRIKPTQVYVGSDATKPTGWVQYDPVTKRREVYINQHDEILSQGALESVDIITHETIHILADHFSAAYKHNPDSIPCDISDEIETMYWTRETNAGIPSSLYAGYAAQLEERIASTIGEKTASYLISRINRHQHQL